MAVISHATRVMLKIFQARFQQYMIQELPDVQAGFRKGRGTRDQIVNTHRIKNKVRELQGNIYLCFIDYAKAFDCDQFSSSVMSESLWPHWLQHARPPYQSQTPRVYSKSCPLSRWCHPTISSSVVPSPPALNLSQNQSLFKWVSFSHQVAKVLEFQHQHQSFQWIFRTDFL